MVVAIDRNVWPGSPPPGVEAVTLDVSQFDHLMRALHDAGRIDRIVHAAYMMGEHAEADPFGAAQINVIGTNNVFESARQLNIDRVGFVGSQGIYGAQQAYGDRDLDEDDSPRVADMGLHYSHTKMLNEYTAEQYTVLYGCDIRTLRAPVLFGHGRTRGLTQWASTFASNPAQGRPVHLPFSATASICMGYIDDYTNQLLTLLDADEPARSVYNAGGSIVTGGELRDAVLRHVPDASITFDDSVPHLRYAHRVTGRTFNHEMGLSPPSLVDRVGDHVVAAREAMSARLGALR